MYAFYVLVLLGVFVALVGVLVKLLGTQLTGANVKRIASFILVVGVLLATTLLPYSLLQRYYAKEQLGGYLAQAQLIAAYNEGTVEYTVDMMITAAAWNMWLCDAKANITKYKAFSMYYSLGIEGLAPISVALIV